TGGAVVLPAPLCRRLRHSPGQVTRRRLLPLGPLLVGPRPFAGEEHVSGTDGRLLLRPLRLVLGRPGAQLLLRFRLRARARDQGAETSSESSLLRHVGRPSGMHDPLCWAGPGRGVVARAGSRPWCHGAGRMVSSWAAARYARAPLEPESYVSTVWP